MTTTKLVATCVAQSQVSAILVARAPLAALDLFNRDITNQMDNTFPAAQKIVDEHITSANMALRYSLAIISTENEMTLLPATDNTEARYQVSVDKSMVVTALDDATAIYFAMVVGDMPHFKLITY